MIKSTSRKTAVAGLMLAIGIYLPFITSHSAGVPGNVFLPMHIPVLLCSFFCGPVYGGVCGFILPYLNCVLTGMPAAYPNAVIMSFELLTYGIVCSVIHNLTRRSDKLRYLYLSLITGMVAGRIVYGIVAAILLFVTPGMGKMTATAALIKGIPGIVIQLIIVPQIVLSLQKGIFKKKNNRTKAVSMIKSGEATCVVVKKNRIISAQSPKGISHIIELHDKGIMKDTFVADTIIGKAAAMIFSLSGVKSCYGQTVSKEAVNWLESHDIAVSYNTCTDIIQNRKGDGMCPMEATVAGVNDAEEALLLLRKKVEELSGAKIKE